MFAADLGARGHALTQAHTRLAQREADPLGAPWGRLARDVPGARQVRACADSHPPEG